MPTQFQRSVWEALNKIPKGKVTTYGELAKFLGRPRAARAVGSAVAKNPDVPATPCHRVVPSSGVIGNYSGEGGTAGKIKLLETEGVAIENGRVRAFAEKVYRF